MGLILCATRCGDGSCNTVDHAVALAKERGDKLAFIFVADVSFLDQMAAPIVVDIASSLEGMGRFFLAQVQGQARDQGMEAGIVIRHGQFREELAAAAQELDASLVLLGRPQGEEAVFEEESLAAFAAGLQKETGLEVRIV